MKKYFYKDDNLYDEDGKSVMMGWERPVMKKVSDLICFNKGDILNIGFGMGIVDTYIQEHNPSSHTIIERHPDVIDKMKEQYKKNKFLNPYRMKNMYNMQTVGQIMMNLDKKEVTVRMDNEMGEFVGINNKLPKNYTPKISVRIEGEKINRK